MRSTRTVKLALYPSLIALAACLIPAAAHAGYGFSLTISPEIHVLPGSLVNVPARFTNTGTLDIVFGGGYSGLAGQFNNLTLQPGQYLDFSYLHIDVQPQAQPGSNVYQHPILGLAFPDGTTLLAASYTQPTDSRFRTWIVVDSQIHALPLNKITQAQPGYFTTSASLDHTWIVLQSMTDMPFAEAGYGPGIDAINPPLLAVPEPGTPLLYLFGLSLTATVLTLHKRASRALPHVSPGFLA